MKKYYKWIVLSNLLVLLIYFNWSVMQKEEIIADGNLVLFRLAPVDPRSLMQGDYMRLDYEVAQKIILPEGSPKRGYCVVKMDSLGIAVYDRIQQTKKNIAQDEYLIGFQKADWRISIGADSYFFEEGSAKKYERAAFGGIRIDNKGNSILVGLYDSTRTLIR